MLLAIGSDTETRRSNKKATKNEKTLTNRIIVALQSLNQMFHGLLRTTWEWMSVSVCMRNGAPAMWRREEAWAAELIWLELTTSSGKIDKKIQREIDKENW